jgi:hypothetical protein
MQVRSLGMQICSYCIDPFIAVFLLIGQKGGKGMKPFIENQQLDRASPYHQAGRQYCWWSS